MKRSPFLRALLAALAASASLHPVLADELWLRVVPAAQAAASAPQRGKGAKGTTPSASMAVPVFRSGDGGLVELTTGSRFPEAGASVPKARIDRTWVRIGEGRALPMTGAREEGALTRLDATYAGLGLAVVGVQLLPLATTLDASAFEAFLKSKGATAALEERQRKKETKKAGKLVSIEGSSTFAFVNPAPKPAGGVEPLGMPFELTPGESPSALRAGASLSVQALLDGKPLPGASVAVHQESAPPIPLVANEEGRVTVPLTAPGPLLVSGAAVRRLTKPDRKKGEAYRSADWEVVSSSLRLEVLPAAAAKAPAPAPKSKSRKKG